MNEVTIKNVIVSLISLVVGGTAGFYIAQRLTAKKYETIIDHEVAQVKDHYVQMQERKVKNPTTGDYNTPLKASKKLLEAQLNDIGYMAEHSVDADDYVPPTTSYRDSSDDGPYVIGDYLYDISFGNYSDDHLDYDKITITYYEGDDTLADEHDQLIPDVEGTVGSDALTRFGENSKDKNTVYVRNDRTATDFEVIRVEGSYHEIVLGMKPPKKRILKMRDE